MQVVTIFQTLEITTLVSSDNLISSIFSSSLSLSRFLEYEIVANHSPTVPLRSNVALGNDRVQELIDQICAAYEHGGGGQARILQMGPDGLPMGAPVGAIAMGGNVGMPLPPPGAAQGGGAAPPPSMSPSLCFF